MHATIGVYTYLTKIHLIALKQKLKVPFNYIRGDFDSLHCEISGAQVSIYQDGLVTVSQSIKQPKDAEKLYGIAKKHVLSVIEYLGDEDLFYKRFIVKEKSVIVISNCFLPVKEVFSELKRIYDYTCETKLLTKHYGDGLVLYSGIKISKEKLEALVQYQIILAAYQHIIGRIIVYNQEVWNEVASVRKKEKLKYKELPKIIDDLLELKREISFIVRRVSQLVSFLEERKSKCLIRSVLKGLKLDDFDEMIALNKTVSEEMQMTYEYIASTIELIEYIYRDNEQKELNILQVIFAIGTIATIVSLGAMPGAKIFLNLEDGQIVGDIVSFQAQDLIFWTIVSVFIGIFLFILLNYLFLHAKKLKIVTILKKRRS